MLRAHFRPKRDNDPEYRIEARYGFFCFHTTEFRLLLEQCRDRNDGITRKAGAVQQIQGSHRGQEHSAWELRRSDDDSIVHEDIN
jgi:hypothetical protein